MAWNIRLTREAEEALSRLPKDQQRMIKRALERMKANPLLGNVKPLKGREWKGVYRRAVGRYRLFFVPSHKEKRVEIISIRLRTEKTYRFQADKRL